MAQKAFPYCYLYHFPTIELISAVEISSNDDAKWILSMHVGQHQFKVYSEVIKFCLVLAWASVNNCVKILFPI